MEGLSDIVPIALFAECTPMRIVVQRVSKASVSVQGKVVGRIGPGLVLLIAIREEDDESEIEYWAEKCVHLRIFPDDNGKMNRSLLETGGEILAVSQFTLYGDARKGRRPSFVDAASPETAQRLYEQFISTLRAKGAAVHTGSFGAMMEVEIHNTGPVTLILER